MPNIFKKRILDEKLQNFQIENFEEKIEIVKRWHFDFHKGTLKTDKETSREQAFNQDFFVKILGYQEKPQMPYTLEPKQTTEKSQFPDLVLGYFDNEKNNTMAVVELKGASVPLDRPQRRELNMSPIQQAFKYKSQYPSCPFVLASNFFEFRLFQDNQLDFEIWTLNDLVNPENDFYFFKKFCFLLQANHFVAKEGKSKIEELIADIRIDEENISKSFYKEYKELRLDLLRDILERNEVARTNIELAIEKAQKIIDRIVFVCFCEDKGLLPEFILQRVLKGAEDNFGSLWSSLKGFFESIDKGSEKLEIPNGYNGGLFAQDNDLNSLQISDDILRKFTQFGRYNFEEDMSVSILGHIFEQSISDLEEIKLKASSVSLSSTSTEQGVMTPCSNEDGKRKKDGIFYTPDYIVDYIIKNSLGRYLAEKEEELKKKYNLKEDIQDETYAKREKLVYEEYKKILENVKVLDPACGSGAFLVKVFDFLLAENKRVAEILDSQLFSAENYLREILKNNIFGVDINQESVEITKLSLWLKTAVKGKKLTTLDGNIKCGNSLIADVEIAGKKAFDWKVEFAEVMKNGGFDVIVGNPPYVRQESIKEFKPDLAKNYEVFCGTADLFVYFYELAYKLLKPNGINGFICSNKFFRAKYGENLRKLILEKMTIESIADFNGVKVFQDATVDSVITIFRKLAVSKNGNFKVVANDLVKFYKMKQSDLTTESFVFGSNVEFSLKKKIERIGVPLKDWDVKIYRGILTGFNEAFIINKQKKDELIAKDYKSAEVIKPLLRGRDIKKYSYEFANLYLLNIHNNPPVDIKKYPAIKEHLDQFLPQIEKRFDKGITPYNLRNCAYLSEFEKEKVVWAETSTELKFYFDDKKMFLDKTCFMMIGDNLKYLNAILNSKLLDWTLRKIASKLGKDGMSLSKIFIEQLPIPKITKEKQQPFIILVDEILELKQKIQDYKELLIEAEKSNNFDREIKLRKEIELFETKIAKNEKKIDELVFAVYDLSEEERGIVENS